MKILKFFLPLLSILFLSAGLCSSPEKEVSKKDRACYYKKKYEDPVIKEMEEANKKRKEDAEKLTAEIKKRQEEKAKKEEKEVLGFDFMYVKKPASPDVFKKLSISILLPSI